ncbi:uncharacterized protein LOC132299807 [Cornus florida]|uniref:uncharacterized protein LOC132299807 n=1 Tax=Cornus florida TaxID=4283 RepID=UPI00289B0301|nr:uncharacterized protein LOC132299807 [Cornus florida]
MLLNYSTLGEREREREKKSGDLFLSWSIMAAPFKRNNPFDHPFFDSSYLFAAVRARRISEKLNPGFNFLKNPITTTPSEKASGDLIRKMLLFRKEDPYEHPSFTDPAITHKELHYEGNQSFSFQSDAPGGPEGICHTSSMARGASTCDGVDLLEIKEEGDKTMSQPLQNLCDLYPHLRKTAVFLQEMLESNPFDDPFFTIRHFF